MSELIPNQILPDSILQFHRPLQLCEGRLFYVAPSYERAEEGFFSHQTIHQYEKLIRRCLLASFLCPQDPDQKLIKRVIAVEGETIRASDKRRFVSVPMGHCWVEGDHVTHSMDSNFFGPVSVGLIFAKASHIVWPPSRWQKLSSYAPRDV
ncbi:mitochondrial inner membrane protease subunit 2 [Trichonephila inaurata madagascariensis]|uniref:Mitochondrial inner membrane protease subunit 2 n=1 Tax=Trichonephila inaurata madagascariensis TaxID=2747483 RepID=A0A8X6WVW3_9ARAC|nr:mitochondrial inner membrane protease subunit 2 [Trichonephila inaurata madagascariensis]